MDGLILLRDCAGTNVFRDKSTLQVVERYNVENEQRISIFLAIRNYAKDCKLNFICEMESSL